MFKPRPAPEQGYRACLGVLRLGKRYGSERLEAACARAAQLGAPRYRTVQNILATGLESLPLDESAAPDPVIPLHPNLRGAAYYADPHEVTASTPESGENARGSL